MANKINYTGSSKILKRLCESVNDIIESGGGGSVVLINKNITTNGTYNAVTVDSADGYREVVVNVSNSYSAGDEGKVVSNGALVAQTSDTVTENDTYDTTLINQLTVNVSGGGGETDTHFSQILNIFNQVGIRNFIINKVGNIINVSAQEYSSGYEGMNVGIYRLTPNTEYTLSFDFQTISGAYFVNQYTYGYKISASMVTSYPTSQSPDSSYNAMDRDLLKHSISIDFTATSDTMYLIFAFVGYSDSVNNNFEITNLQIAEKE